MGAIRLRVLRAASETHARYRKLEALAHCGEYVSSPRRIPVLVCSRNVCRSIWMGRCPEGRGGGGVQTTHCLAGPCSAGSGGGADLGPRGTSDTGLTEHQLLPHADGNSAAGPANGHSQDSWTHPHLVALPDTVRIGGRLSPVHQYRHALPILVDNDRFSPRRIYAGLPALVAPHFQWRISGRSSPYLSMYALCSISLSLSCCFR